jgi:hypothetical protein
MDQLTTKGETPPFRSPETSGLWYQSCPKALRRVSAAGFTDFSAAFTEFIYNY